MTLFQIDILMHYTCSHAEHDVVRRNPPIWAETREFFLREGLLELRSEPSNWSATYKATDRCEAYMEALRNVPLPVQKWVMPE